MNGDVTFHFDDIAELDSAVRKLADISQVTSKEVLGSQIRLLAVDLAYYTLPVGREKRYQTDHATKIARRIRFEYISVGYAVDFLNNVKPGLGAEFSRHVRKKRFSDAADLMNRHSKENFTVGSFDRGKMHNLNRTGKHPDARMVVVDYSKVMSFAKTAGRKSGFAKSGFAAAARQVGGVRGIPGWVTRQGGSGSGMIASSGNTVTAEIRNNVPYIRDALLPDGEERAIANRKKQVTAVIKRMMDRKMRAASKSLK